MSSYTDTCAPAGSADCASPWAAAQDQDSDQDADLYEGAQPEIREERLPGRKSPAQSPLHRLRQHRPYWLAKMKAMGTICALTLSILATGYRLDWSPKFGPATPVFQTNHPSASVHGSFTSEAIAAGVAMCIMRPCSREFLT